MGVGAWVMVSSWFEDLPDYKSADAFNVAMPTYVYASDRETVIARLQLEYREPVEIGQIDQKFINAIIAVEDARFYEHSGVDYYGVMRALINNLTGGRLEGASTITQQFVRNTILSGEMDEISIKRKVREAYIATKIEEMYSKDEILLMYQLWRWCVWCRSSCTSVLLEKRFRLDACRSGIARRAAAVANLQ